jgi:hypothetical protein
MKRLALCAVLFSVCAAVVPAYATDIRMSKTDGNKLLSICTAKAPNLMQGCNAFIDGVADTIGVYQHLADKTDGAPRLVERTCISDNATGQQLRDIVVQFLQAHAADRARYAALLSVQALHQAFPCHSE